MNKNLTVNDILIAENVGKVYEFEHCGFHFLGMVCVVDYSNTNEKILNLICLNHYHGEAYSDLRKNKDYRVIREVKFNFVQLSPPIVYLRDVATEENLGKEFKISQYDDKGKKIASETVFILKHKDEIVAKFFNSFAGGFFIYSSQDSMKKLDIRVDNPL